MIPEETYNNIIEELSNIVNDNTPFLDLFNAFVFILENNGITGRPLKTLQMAQRLVEEAERRKRERRGH